jgi:tetratricopeptide (TPR) repeat protein
MTGNGLLQDARVRYQARDYAGTAELIEQAEPARRVAQPELGFLLAASWRQLGRADAALELAIELTDASLLRGTPRLALRRINLEAMLRFEAGATGIAEALWLHLLGRASADEDAEYIAHACNNLGVVYTLQTRLDDALASYERALVAYQRMGERLGMGQAHQNLGIAHREAERPDHADEHFESARYHATAAGDDRLLGRVETERALLLARRGDDRLADATARRARSRLQLVGDRAGTGEAWRAAGLIAISAGRHADAVAPLEQALEIARATGHALLEAETLLGLWVARRALGTAGEQEARAEADTLFERIGAIQWCRAMERWLIEPGATLH